jgi:hypothetical protein
MQQPTRRQRKELKTHGYTQLCDKSYFHLNNFISMHAPQSTHTNQLGSNIANEYIASKHTSWSRQSTRNPPYKSILTSPHRYRRFRIVHDCPGRNRPATTENALILQFNRLLALVATALTSPTTSALTQ